MTRPYTDRQHLRRQTSSRRAGSRAAVEAFRGGGPGDEQATAIVSASVAEYDVAGVRELT